MLRGELHRGRNGAAGEVDLASRRPAPRTSTRAPPRCRRSPRGSSPERASRPRSSPPYDARAVFAAARAGDALAPAVVEEVARRIALHIVPIAAVTDVALVVLGGGIGANGDLLLDPIRGAARATWLPFPPRVEVSGLGEAAVLTGALAVGLELARERVFANRRARVA